MDDDIEAAFVKYARELKNKGSGNATRFSSNEGNEESQSTSPDFSIMGSRGLSYKRIADALKDQSKRSEGKFHQNLMITRFKVSLRLPSNLSYS